MKVCNSVTFVIIGLAFFSLTDRFAFAVPFGTFDPRSQAMGGTGVASGTSANAAYYNPALLSMYKTRKEVGRNSRFIFPTVTASVSEFVIDNQDLSDENLEQNLNNAISAFNTNMNSQTATGVLNAATDLSSRLDELVDGPAYADANVGMVLGIGHKYEGGSIIINRRGVGSAVVEDFTSDLALLEDYVEAMQYVESGGTAGAPHPELYDPVTGQLTDQTGNLTSEGNGSGFDITEIGMAMSKEFQILGHGIAIGITPKILHVITYDFHADAATGGTDSDELDNEDWDVNLDIGFAHQFNSQWRVGLIFKNVRSLTFTSALGTELNIDPQVRVGVAYFSPWGLYSLDADVIENEPIGYGSPSQMLALGGEWEINHWFQFRAGISRNMAGIGNNSDPLFSTGIRWDFGGILDLTYAMGESERAAGFQLGYRF